MCLYSIYLKFGLPMISDIPSQIEGLIEGESDLTTKRNAFLLLFHTDMDKALEYLNGVLGQDESLADLGDVFQLAVLELIRKYCIAKPQNKPLVMGIIFSLSHSKSSSGIYILWYSIYIYIYI